VVIAFAFTNPLYAQTYSHQTIILLSDRIDAIDQKVKKKLEATDASNKKLREEITELKKQVETLSAQLEKLKQLVGNSSTEEIAPRSAPRSFIPIENKPTNSIPIIRYDHLNQDRGSFSAKEQGLVKTLMDYAKDKDLTDSQRKAMRDIIEVYK
jgi:hypothetical protein